MEYGGGDYDQQRPYKGYAAQPPTPRGQGPRDPFPQQQQGYDAYDNGYSQGGYGPGPGRGQMPPRGRGGPPMNGRGRPPPGRGGYPPQRVHNQGPGRGRGGPAPYGHSQEHSGNEQPLLPNQFSNYLVANSFSDSRRPPPPQGRGGYGPSNHGVGRMHNDDDYMSHQMGSMDLNSGTGYDSHATYDGYGAPNQTAGPPRGAPPQASYEQRRAPPAGSGNAYGYDDDYSSGGGYQNEFGPPARSMTTPINDQRQYMGNQTVSDGVPYNGPAGKNIPARPSTASGNRPNAQGAAFTQAAPQNLLDPYGGNADMQRQASAVSLTDVFDSYYDSARNSGHEESLHSHNPSQAKGQHFETASHQGSRSSFEQTMRPQATGQPQRGAHQVPQMNHAQSFANVPEPQAAVFEMVGDTPSVPPVPSFQQESYQSDYGQGYNQGHGRNEAYNHPPPQRGPSAPPGPSRGPPPGSNYPGYPGISRPGTTGPPQRTSSDTLPTHPAPVRPGLMPNSLVNPMDKPPPVRNYGGVAVQPAYNQAPPQNQIQPGRQYDMPPVPAPQTNLSASAQGEDAPVTTQELEQLRMMIKMNPNDQGSALKLAKRLIEASDILVASIPDPRARNKARERYLADAHKVLKKLASAQNFEAMFILADNLGRGAFGYEPDNKEAFTLYQSAAKLGHAGAAYRTAVCCEIGHEEGGGTRKDPLKAMQWYKRAATLGDPPAMYKIGMILLKGLLGQPRNTREAVVWLKRAAERADADNPHSLHELGLLYESAQPNDAIIRDEPYAFSLFQQGAELGYKFSQFRLGCVYEYGLMGCHIDPRLSIFWYSKAAMQEEHQSELALSGWYLTGTEGVLNQSDTEAYLWARKAAVAGLAKAEYAMGYFTEVGIGIAPNLEDAKRWYWRAAGESSIS